MASLLVVTLAASGCRPASADLPESSMRLADIRLMREAHIVRALVPPGTTLAALLQAHELLAHETTAIVTRITELFDPRRFRAGQPYRIERLFDGRLRTFEYEIDGNRRLVVQRRDEVEPQFEAALEAIPKLTEQVSIGGEISARTPSLVGALEASGQRIELALALAEIFSGELDFNSDLQPGDSFRLVVERSTRVDGSSPSYGPVLAAELVNARRQLQAVRFVSPDGRAGYYDAQGNSLTRFFLKSPLKFEPRVTSGFSRSRRHPILAYNRAHNGVDYAAPAGAPVAAVASGVVTFAGWAGGGGRTVKLRHAAGYESEYLHLSTIADGIRAGARVAQGALVGRVGSTGLATGPHLHYGLRRNGAYMNPVLAHRNMPPGDPLTGPHLAVFSLERDRLMQALTDTRPRATND
jgi:murein DD-endopeptidase MepM/ murein hydrolase activator NlpD